MDKLPNSWVTKRETNYICYQVGRITCDIFLLLELWGLGFEKASTNAQYMMVK